MSEATRTCRQCVKVFGDAARFATEEAVLDHLVTVHPSRVVKYLFKEATAAHRHAMLRDRQTEGEY